MMQWMLIGNPNVGKTTLFNNLTGANAQVGNWSGVTVDRVAGTIRNTGDLLIDLPGTYHVSPSSADEGVVTFGLMNETYDGILNIVDGAHLKRNLHLTIQLLETGRPVLVALNMMDELARQGLQADLDQLGLLLGCPVVGMTARRQAGTEELKGLLPALKGMSGQWRLDYGPLMEKAIGEVEVHLAESGFKSVSVRWLAIQALEGNQGILDSLPAAAREQVEAITQEAEGRIVAAKEAFSLKGAIFNRRRELILDITSRCLESTGTTLKSREGFGRLDYLLTHPIYGLAAFVLIMGLIYGLTFDLAGNILSQGFEAVLNGWIYPLLQRGLNWAGAGEGSFLQGLFLDGLAAGAGGVIIFLPQILILFFCLSLMEGTGYMARVAIVMDTLFSRFGLNGKAIVPLVTGFGCNVPAIMATRTIASRQERLKTIAVIPFTSCSARLPVYVLIIGLFFPTHQGLAIMSLYVLGLAIALLSARLFSVSLFRDHETTFLLEVPPYRLPQLKNTLNQTLKRGTEFFHTAGKFIVAGSMILWFLQYAGPGGLDVEADASYLAAIGNFLVPVFRPIGLGSWELVSSLLVGFLAKELVASSMLIILGGPLVLGELISPAQAVSFLVFSLLYIPCLATVGVMYRETRSVKDTAWMVAYGLLTAFLTSFLAFQLLRLFGL